MRAVQIALLIISFNLMASIVIQADFFGSGGAYYESEVVDYAQSQDSESYWGMGDGVPIVGDIVQITAMFSIIKGIFSILSFSWITGLLPTFITATELYSAIILAFNSLLIILIAVAVLELISKQWGSLK